MKSIIMDVIFRWQQLFGFIDNSESSSNLSVFGNVVLIRISILF